MHRLKHRGGVLAALFIIYAACQIILAMAHEPWRDESQAWLIARDSDAWHAIVKVAREEGHPALWSLLLMPLAKSGAPYWSMRALSVAIMLVAAALLLRSQMPLWLRACMLFSSCFFYWTPVVSRSYCLVALAVAMLAFLYPRRIKHPWLFSSVTATMFQIHAVVFGFAGALALVHAFELRERGRTAYPFILPAISAIIAFFELAGGMDKAFALPDDIYGQLLYLVSGQKPTSGFLGTFGADWMLAFVAVVIIAALIALVFLSPRVAFIQWCGFLWFLFVHLVIHPLGSLQKVSAWLCLFLLASSFTSELVTLRPAQHAKAGPGDLPWRANHLHILVSSLVLVPCLLTVPATLEYSRLDLQGPFSVGKELASLMENVSQDDAILVPIDDMGSQYAVSNSLPYLTKRQTMWSSSIHSEMSYATADFREYWTQHNAVLDEEAPEQTARIIDRYLPDSQQQIIAVACTEAGDAGLDDSFQNDSRYTRLGSIREAGVDESLRGYGGIRCTLYEYES